MSERARDKAERFLQHLEPLQGRLTAFCRRSLQNQNDMADTLQSALVTAYRDFDLYVEGTNFRAWMFRIVSYEVLNRNRAASRHREVELPKSVSDPRRGEESIAADSLADRLLDAPEIVLDACEEGLAGALLALPDLERNIFLLRAVGEFKYREIAEILEVPIGTVMGLLARSRDRLRKDLAEYAKTQNLLPGNGS